MAPNNTAKEGNDLSRASLEESRRQFNQQQAEKKRKEETAKANAFSVRRGGNAAYGSTEQTNTDFTSGMGGQYSLLNMAGTPPVMNDLLSGLGNNTKLGG